MLLYMRVPGGADLVKCMLSLYINGNQMRQAGIPMFICSLEKPVPKYLLKLAVSMDALLFQPVVQTSFSKAALGLQRL